MTKANNFAILIVFIFITNKASAVVFEIVQDWSKASFGYDIAVSKFLLKRPNGLVMASPIKQLLIKGSDRVSVFSEIEGYAITITAVNNSCYNLIVNYHVGNNLRAIKFFNIFDDGSVDERFSNLTLTSNLGKIEITEKHVKIENQIIDHETNERKIVTSTFKFGKDSLNDNACTLTERNK